MQDNSNIHTSNTLQVFWVALGGLSSLGLSIISAAILSRYFDKAEYGTYKQILYVYTTLLVIFSAGLPRVYAYFLPRYSLEEGKAIVWKISKVLFIAGALFSMFLFLFSGYIADILKNEELEYGLKVFSPMPMLLLPTLGIEGIFSTYKKALFIAIYNTLSRILMLIFIVVPIIIFKADYVFAIYGWLIASFITLIMANFFKGIPFKGIESKVTTLKYREIFSYSLPLVYASLWGISIKAADEFYISRFFGAKVFAEFSNGFIELPFVTMITASTSLVLMPIFSKVFHENKGIEELLITWRKALNKSAIIIYPLVVYFITYSSEIMLVLYSYKYKESSVYFQVNMILNFFNIIIFAPLFLSMGKTKLYARIHMVIAIFAWVSGYVIILVFNSPLSIAINSTAISICKILYFTYLSSRLLKIGYFELFPVKSLSLLVFHSVIVAVIVKFIEVRFLLLNSLIMNLIITSILYGSLILFTGPLFKIDYMSILQPLIKNKLKK